MSSGEQVFPSGPEHAARGIRRKPRRATVDELLAANEEARKLINQAWMVSRVLRSQLRRYEQLVRVDSWRDVVTASIPGDDLAALALHGAELAGLLAAEQAPEVTP